MSGFDNNYSTFVDLSSVSGCNSFKIGIDFGEPVCIQLASALPRNGNADRFANLCLYGTQKGAVDSDWMSDANGVKISASTGASTTYKWYDFASTSTEFFRTCYLGREDLSGYWGANLTELFFYGYPKTPKGLIAPSEAAASVRKGHLVLAWADDKFATGWLVERRNNDKCQWVRIGETSVAAFDDTDAVLDGSTYQYRVTATNGTEAASQVMSVAATPVPDTPPWSGEVVIPTDRSGGVSGLRWADTGDLTNFTFVVRFVRGSGATATKFVPFVRTSLTGGNVLEGALDELPDEGWFRIERMRGVVTLSYRAVGGAWKPIGTSDGFPVGSVAVGVSAIGGSTPLAGYTFSDVKLEAKHAGLLIVVR